MILITGANGQLGQSFRLLAFDYPEHSFLFASSADLDISDPIAVEKYFAEHKNITWCINCAAYTAVDKAESDVDRAYAVNVLGPKHLAQACRKLGAALIQISTDYVYHNRQNTPFKEGDPESPKGVYASTKLQGDKAALRSNPHTMIVRTSWVYAAMGHNFVKTMLKLGRERSHLNVVFDQIGTPTYAPDLAQALMWVIEKTEAHEVPMSALRGIYHYSNEGVTSWYDFAVAIFEIKNIHCRVMPIESAGYPTPAKRPPFSVLNKQKIRITYGLDIPHWRESLRICLDLLK